MLTVPATVPLPLELRRRLRPVLLNGGTRGNSFTSQWNGSVTGVSLWATKVRVTTMPGVMGSNRRRMGGRVGAVVGAASDGAAASAWSPAPAPAPPRASFGTDCTRTTAGVPRVSAGEAAAVSATRASALPAATLPPATLPATLDAVLNVLRAVLSSRGSPGSRGASSSGSGVPLMSTTRTDRSQDLPTTLNVVISQLSHTMTNSRSNDPTSRGRNRRLRSMESPVLSANSDGHSENGSMSIFVWLYTGDAGAGQSDAGNSRNRPAPPLFSHRNTVSSRSPSMQLRPSSVSGSDKSGGSRKARMGTVNFFCSVTTVSSSSKSASELGKKCTVTFALMPGAMAPLPGGYSTVSMAKNRVDGGSTRRFRLTALLLRIWMVVTNSTLAS